MKIPKSYREFLTDAEKGLAEFYSDISSQKVNSILEVKPMTEEEQTKKKGRNVVDEIGDYLLGDIDEPEESEE